MRCLLYSSRKFVHILVFTKRRNFLSESLKFVSQMRLQKVNRFLCLSHENIKLNFSWVSILVFGDSRKQSVISVRKQWRKINPLKLVKIYFPELLSFLNFSPDKCLLHQDNIEKINFWWLHPKYLWAHTTYPNYFLPKISMQPMSQVSLSRWKVREKWHELILDASLFFILIAYSCEANGREPNAINSPRFWPPLTRQPNRLNGALYSRPVGSDLTDCFVPCSFLW